ncbi:hypothetical protein MQE22_08505 [Acidithiobacillus sp. YTS05]|nr:hypothetical protein MQE22_08505 [Acidithiobacillus sp. YTS05]
MKNEWIRQYVPQALAEERSWIQEELRVSVPLQRAPIQGWVMWAFWGLRIYIVVMLVMVGIGFARGMH